MNIIKNIKCAKCNGEGKLTHFKHVANGECFACRGTGVRTVAVEVCNAFDKACAEMVAIVDMFDFFAAEIGAARCPAA